MVELATKAKEVVRKLREHGFEAYFAGGCVRDMLLGKEPKDIDIATSAHPAEVAAIFSHTFTAGAQLGERFGVLSIVFEGDIFEIASFRADSAESDGRRPDHVVFTDARTDAQRRDFTVNALFYDPLSEQVLDFVEGRRDLEERLVRFIGDPVQRIQEDSLRLLRAVRFKHQMDGQYEPETYNAIRDNAALVTRVSWERIAAELNRMLLTPTRAAALEDLQDLGLLRHILPEVENLKGVAQPRQYHHEGSVWNHAMQALATLPEDASLELVWGALLHDIGKPKTFSVAERVRFDGHAEVSARMAEEILTRLRFPRKSREAIVWAVEHHMSLLHLLEPEVTRKTRDSWYGNPAFPLLLGIQYADASGTIPVDLTLYEHLKVRFETWQEEQAALPVWLLTGEDIMRELQVPPSEKVGQILEAAREAQREGVFDTYDAAIKWLEKEGRKML